MKDNNGIDWVPVLYNDGDGDGEPVIYDDEDDDI